MKILRATIIAVCIFTIVTLSLPSLSFAEIPRTINYQGKLTTPSGTPVSDGTYSIAFRIYDVEAGGSPLWFETQSILVQKGIFSTQIGSTADLNLSFDKPYYLGIKVGSDTEMTPRQRLSSSAYAFTAINSASSEVADTIADETKLLPSGVILMWSGSIADIPNGWVLCNGTNGTPDLRDRFIFGAGNFAAPGDNRVVGNRMSLVGTGSNISMKITGAGARAEGGQSVAETSTDYMPPYYALAFIMKV